jgi:hypothetical protein
MTVVIIGIYAGFVRWGSHRQALIFVTFLLISEQAMMTTRFDIVPASLTIGAVWAAERQRWNWAHGLLSLGVLTKLYPIFCVPLLLCAEGRSIWRVAASQNAAWRQICLSLAQRLGVQIGVVGTGLLFVQWRSPDSALLFITYAARRPVQVESTLGMITWLGGLFGIPFRLSLGFGSVNWSGPLADALLPWTLPALAVACGVVYLWYVCGRMKLPTAFLTVVCVILLTNRVFSTQYLIWAIPLVAAAEEWDWAWVVLGILQTAEDALYPYTYPTQSAGDILRFIIVLSLRNVALLFVTARLFWRNNTQIGSPVVESAAIEESK